ncbi:MAG: hypothetical protein HY814_07040 [Candidatus Riflebacteria bacterium]|nr:hypothetical protein [Candidatus Riflebacteria bacterium]
MVAQRAFVVSGGESAQSRWLPGLKRGSRACLEVLLLLALAVVEPAAAALLPGDLTLTAPVVARRQEVGQSVVDPTPVTLTVRNSSATGSLRVDTAVLVFSRGAEPASGTYLVTNPTLPVTVTALGSANLVFQVRPSSATPVLDPVDLTATVGVTDLGTSTPGTGSAGTRWSVVPGSLLSVGQIDLYSREAYRRGLADPMAVYSDGTRLFVADSDGKRVLVWNSIPTTNHAVPELVLGQPDLARAEENSGGRSASSLSSARGITTYGSRLYVTDYGNNRVLVWNGLPTSNNEAADFVVGQSDFTSSTAGCSSTKMRGPWGVSLSNNKLFVADRDNHRVLMWDPVPSSSGTQAAIVFGQMDFTGNQVRGGGGGVNGMGMAYPQGLFAGSGRLFVADSECNRVMLWSSIPNSNGEWCDYVLGQPSRTELIQDCQADLLGNTEGVFYDGGLVFAADGLYDRVLVWNSVPTASGVAADAAMGQSSLTEYGCNNGGISSRRLCRPRSVCRTADHVFVADTDNNRVLIYNDETPGTSEPATVVLGQPDMVSSEELNPGVNASVCSVSRVASDGTRLFVADGADNRVLIWDSLPGTNAQAASRVLGQASFTTKTANHLGPSASSLYTPEGLAVSGGKLFVSDRNNHRVLVWNGLPSSNNQAADLVLGQPNAISNTANNGGLSAASLAYPRGVAAGGGKLVVADGNNHRVLLWNSVPVTSAVPADVVLGQPDALTNTANNGGVSASRLNLPMAAATDGTKLAVTDYANHRVLLWNTFPTANGQPADVVLGQPNPVSNTSNNGGLSASSLNYPHGVTWDGRKLHVADRSNNRVLVWNGWPTANGQAADSVLGQSDLASAVSGYPAASNLPGPVDVALSPGLVWVADATPRVVKFQAEYFEVSLTYDQPDRFYRAEPFVVTATFGTVPAAFPTIEIGGGSAGIANDVAAIPMTATGDSKVFTFARTVASSDDGTFAITLTANTATGTPLTWQPSDRTFEVDATAPTVALTYSQADRLYKSEAFALTATFSETLAATPTATVTGLTAGGANDVTATQMTATADPRVWKLDRTLVAGDDDTFTVTLAASDAVGNPLAGQPADNTFAVDATLPAVALTYSNANRCYKPEAFTVTATFSEAITPAAPTLTINGTIGGGSVSNVPMTMGADRSVWTFTTTILSGDSQGTHTLTLAAADAAGNPLGAQPAARTFLLDTVVPTVTLAYNQTDRVYKQGEPFKVTATFSEDISPTAPAITLDGTVGGGTVSNVPMTQGANLRVWTWQTTPAAGDSEGTHTVTLAAVDAGGNPLAAQPADRTFEVWTHILAPADVALTAPIVARRQETGQPVVDPTAVTVTVANSSATNSLRVDGIALAFFRGVSPAPATYDVTPPSVGMTISPLASRTLVFQVRPAAATAVLEPVDLTATVDVTDLTASQPASGSATRRWSVVPGSLLAVGQVDLYSREAYRRGLSNPTAVYSDGDRLFVADRVGERVLIWDDGPAVSHQAADLVLGWSSLSDRGSGGTAASILQEVHGIASYGNNLIVADSGRNRVLIWNGWPTANNEAADVVVGQVDFTSTSSGCSEYRMSQPWDVSAYNNRLLVSDRLNNRVLFWDPIRNEVRTLCLYPPPEIRAVLEAVREFAWAA